MRSAAWSVYNSAHLPVLCRGRAVRPSALPGAPFGVNQRAQIVEAIGGNQPTRDQFPKRRLHLGLEPACAPHNVSKKRRSALAQKVENVPGNFTQAPRLVRVGGRVSRDRVTGAWAMGRHPVGFLANEECNGGHAGRNHPAFSGRRVIEGSGMRRQASPTDRAGQAKLVEPFGIVVRNTAAQDMPFPRAGRNFEPLQLAQYIKCGAFSLNLTSRREVLPAQ